MVVCHSSGPGSGPARSLVIAAGLSSGCSMAEPAGPVCSLQRVAPQGAPGNSASLWQPGIEAQALTTAIGQLAQRLTDLATGDTSRTDALEESLVFVLTQLQPAATRFSFPNHELSRRQSQAVVIDDEEALDPEWLAVTTTSKPDRAAIKEALNAGRQISGGLLLSCRSWRFH